MSTFEVKIHKAVVTDIEGADRIQVCQPEGMDYQCVIQKGYLATGDSFVYIPEAAVVPDWLLEEIGLLGKLDGPQHNRVKAHKFRQTLSQGLAYVPPVWTPGIRQTRTRCMLLQPHHEPFLQVIDEAGEVVLRWDWVPNASIDLAEYLGIVKYEPEVPTRFRGAWTPAPNHVAIPGGSIWQSYTDIENIKKEPNLLEPEEFVTMREKLHGTCFIAYWAAPVEPDAEPIFAVSSKGIAKRGFSLLQEEGNVYWDTARRYQVADNMARVAHTRGWQQMMLFGEIIGVQDLKYGLKDGETKLFLFDVLAQGLNALGGEWVNDDNSLDAVIQMLDIAPLCPLVYQGPWNKELGARFAQGPSLLLNAEKQIREGVVVGPQTGRREARAGRVKLKIINPAYLTRKGETTEYE